MSSTDGGPWTVLESWMPHLFLVAGACSLVAAANYGVAWVFEGVSFNSWVGLTVLLARVTSLLGVAGLSVRILDRRQRVGQASRAVVVLALLFTGSLLTAAVAENLGIEPPIMPVLGLGTVALSLLTYTLFGGAILSTDAHPRLIGLLLLGATAALLFGLFGRVALPIGIVGTIAELLLVATHVGIGYRLVTGSKSGESADLSPETATE